MKQVAISACPHALGLIGERLDDPGTDPEALLQFVRSPECALPQVFVLARVGELVAFSTHKIAVREPQFGCASSTLCTASRSRANEVGATAAEPTTQIGDGDGIDNVLPSPIPDPDSIGKTEPLSFRAEVDRGDSIAIGPLAGTGPTGPKAALLRQLIDVKRPIGFHRFTRPVLPPP